MIVIAPFTRPEAPRPAIALPIINIGDVLAAAETNEPNSNTIKKTTNVYWRTVSVLLIFPSIHQPSMRRACRSFRSKE
jgi:hypothetical protein